MAGVAARFVAALAMVSALASPLGAQRDPLATDSVAVDVRVHGLSAEVSARYWFPRPVRALDLTYLTNTCASVGPVAATRNGSPVAFAVDTARPWVALHDTTDVTAEGDGVLQYHVRYSVALGSAKRVAVPLVQPARALDQRNAAVRPKVRVTVVSTVAPQFPRFDRLGDSLWSTSTIAIPATVVMEGAENLASTACDDAIRSAGDNDGFSWRFMAFVGTLILWIPLYFAWATRAQRADDVVEEDA